MIHHFDLFNVLDPCIYGNCAILQWKCAYRTQPALHNVYNEKADLCEQLHCIYMEFYWVERFELTDSRPSLKESFALSEAEDDSRTAFRIPSTSAQNIEAFINPLAPPQNRISRSLSTTLLKKCVNWSCCSSYLWRTRLSSFKIRTWILAWVCFV